MKNKQTLKIGFLCSLALAPVLAHGQSEQLLKNGVRYLKNVANSESTPSRQALAALALIKSGEPLSDPVVKQLVEKVRSRAVGGVYKPSLSLGPDNYEAGIVCMVLCSADSKEYYPEIEAVARYIMSRQTTFGAWDYGDTGNNGDTSMTQYAVLGLWEAASAGVDVPLSVWDNALYWLCCHQDPSGGFTYHPTKPPSPPTKMQQGSVTHTMGAGGAASVLICRTQLPFPQKRRVGIAPTTSELLIPIEKEGDLSKLKCTRELADDTVERANKWMGSKMTVDQPTGLGGHYYFLYALERYAELSGLKTVGKSEWYDEGVDFLKAKQGPDGSWKGPYEPIVDTSFAVLFLGRSTKKTMARIQLTMVGKGTMVGGRGLPDPNELPTSVAKTQLARYRSALRVPAENLLNLLDDPDADLDAEEITASFETASAEEIIRSLKGDLGRLQAQAKNPRMEVRAGVMAALGKTNNENAIPILIMGLEDKDPEVYAAARTSLIKLSRRTDAFGLPAKRSSRADAQKGIDEVKSWYANLRIMEDPDRRFAP